MGSHSPSYLPCCQILHHGITLFGLCGSRPMKMSTLEFVLPLLAIFTSPVYSMLDLNHPARSPFENHFAVVNRHPREEWMFPENQHGYWAYGVGPSKRQDGRHGSDIGSYRLKGSAWYPYQRTPVTQPQPLSPTNPHQPGTAKYQSWEQIHNFQAH